MRNLPVGTPPRMVTERMLRGLTQLAPAQQLEAGFMMLPNFDNFFHEQLGKVEAVGHGLRLVRS